MTDAPFNGETALWRAVIHQAFQDATFGQHGAGPGRKAKARSPSADRQRHAHAAREWLLGDSGYFRRVCDLAGFEPEVVRASALVAIAGADYELMIVEHEVPKNMPQNRAEREEFRGKILVGERDNWTLRQ